MARVNMSARDRRQIYIVYNPIANKPLPVENPQSDFDCSRNPRPIAMGHDEDIFTAMEICASAFSRR